MRFTKRTKLLMITGLLLQFSVGLANSLEDPNVSFINAACRGDLESVTIALDDPQVNVNYQQKNDIDYINDGPTALICAAYGGHTEIVRLLLTSGANPNIINECTWLVGTASQGTALINAVDHINAGYTEIVKLLLEAGADPNIKDTNGRTALIIAAKWGCFPEIVKLLLDAGADPNIEDNDGCNALYGSTNLNRAQVVKELLNTNVDLNAKNNRGVTSLMRAADNGHTEILRLLLEAGADPNIEDNDGCTALVWAANLGMWGFNNGDMYADFHQRRTESVRLLLTSGANPHIKDDDGLTALMWGAKKGCPEIVKLLLDAGADPNVKDNDGYTALFYGRWQKDIEQLIKNAQKK